MMRHEADPAVVAGLQQAAIGFAGTEDISSWAGVDLEEFVSRLIDIVVMTPGAGPRTADEKREFVIAALRSIGFDYSASKILEEA